MKNTITMLAGSIAAAALAGGCASAGSTGGGAAGANALAAGGAIAYCQRDKLVVEGGNLTCNWSATAREACEVKAVTTIASSAVSSGPDKSTMCADGSPLVRIAKR